MTILMVLLWAGIGIYYYFASESRLRQIAADSLGGLVGGHVSIGSAELSILEGLDLKNVRMWATGADGADLTILDAENVSVRCNLRDLLSGRLSASQIIVSDPRVQLTEDVATGRWNVGFLGQSSWPATPAGAPAFTEYPEVLLRSAQVDFGEARDGVVRRVGGMSVDGRFGPLGLSSAGAHKYEFTFQSSGGNVLGPAMIGVFDAVTGHVSATLRNVVFGSDTEAMLPSLVSGWCRQHDLAGATRVKMDYDPAGFKVEAELDGVQLAIAPRPDAPAVAFSDAFGTLIFTNTGIQADHLSAVCENNRFDVDGLIGGYSPDAPMDVSVRSIGPLNLAENIPSVAALPPVALGIYNHFKPSGRATLQVRLIRPTAGGPLHCQAQINVLDGSFTFADLPYPVHHVTGSIRIEHDPTLGFDVLRLTDLHGRGADGSANEHTDLSINGWIGPFDNTAGGVVNVRGTGIAYEEALRHALPPPVRRAIDWLDIHHEGCGSDFTASFSTQARREEAGKTPGLPWIVDTDLKFAGARATCAAFPYRVDQIEGQAQIRPGFVNLIGVQGRHGPAAILLGGKIRFNESGTQYAPELTVAAEDVPIDADLLAALPPQPRRRVEALGVSGKLDALGAIKSPLPGFDLDLSLTDGAFAPHGIAAASGVSGHAHLTHGGLTDIDLRGHRGDSVLIALGSLNWTGDAPAALLTVQADQLLFDQHLRDLLPARAQEAWDQIQPSGTVDVRLDYDSRRAAGPLAMNLRPVKLAIAPKLAPEAAPLRLDGVVGEVNLAPGVLAEWNLTANDRGGQMAMNGSWKLDDPNAAWEMHLSGRNLAADEQLLRSLPAGLAQVVGGLKFNGAVGFEFTKLSYHPARNGGMMDSALRPAGPDIDFAVQIDCTDASMNVGVPLDSVRGTANLSGVIRNGVLQSLDGDLQSPALKIALRPATDLSATISKPADAATLHISDLRAHVAGGDLAGGMAVTLTDNGVDRYAMRLILNDADVSQLSGVAEGLASAPDPNLIGRVSASLDLSGGVGDRGERRGSGSVRVSGDHMYQIPLMLGLLQVTNLSLPTSSPFQQATARYSVDGNRVTLEQIQLAGKDMAIQGSGHLDFATGKVDLSFTTDSDKWLNVPIVGPIWNKAQGELMRIHVKGTVSAPRVSASSFDTFTTTVDQVFKGEPER
jgi:hypothetical protein